MLTNQIKPYFASVAKVHFKNFSGKNDEKYTIFLKERGIVNEIFDENFYSKEILENVYKKCSKQPVLCYCDNCYNMEKKKHLLTVILNSMNLSVILNPI
jgi:hypothetical protein